MGASRYLADDGVRVAYHDWNEGAGGPPIVLQHGFTTSSVRNWFQTGIVEALARGGAVGSLRSMRVVTVKVTSPVIQRAMEVSVWHAI